MSRSLDEEKAWLAPILASAALEVTVVGDADPDAVIADAAKTIGTLPKRDAEAGARRAAQGILPEGALRQGLRRSTPRSPRASSRVYWPTSDGMDVHRARRLGMLAEILTDRLRVKIREQMGSTYSPQVASSASDFLPGYGYLAAIVIVGAREGEAGPGRRGRGREPT